MRGLFLILITRLACCLHIDDSVRHEFANVSFSVNDGQLDLHVWHNHATVCRRLYDDMNYVTETRAENGSRVLLRGSGGVLLQSSSDGIECRLEVRNQEGNAYTIQDVPTLPGTFSAYIVFANGETLQIDKKNATAFVAVVPAHLETTQRRRLQSYFTFECKYPKLQYLKVGVVMDAAFIKKAGDAEKGKAEIRKLFKRISVAYEEQFNMHITPFQILAYDDSECKGCSPFAKCGSTSGNLNKLQGFRGKAGKRNAGWHLFSSCKDRSGVVGVAYLGTMGTAKMAVGVSSFLSEAEVVMVPAHEIGHNLGAKHTFDHGKRQGAGDGIMDYVFGEKSGQWTTSEEGGDLFQFHKLHEREMCAVMKRLNDKGARGLVDWEERWIDNPTDTPSDPTDTPSDPSDSPSDPSDSPSDPSDSPSDPSDSPSDPTDSSTPNPSDASSGSTWIIVTVVSILSLFLCLLMFCCISGTGSVGAASESPARQQRVRKINKQSGRRQEPSRKSNRKSKSKRRSSNQRPSSNRRPGSRKSTSRR